VRLVCDSCGTRFRIADELVRGKALSVRCRSCSKVLEVTALPTPAREGRGTPHRARRLTLPPPLPPGREEWYLAVGSDDVGPMGLAELRLRIRRGEVGGDDLVWREGLASWEPVIRLPEVRIALGEPRPRRRTIPPALPRVRRQTVEDQAESPRLTVIQGGQAVALAPRARVATQPQPQAAPHPAPVARPQLARWPVLALVAGGVALVVAAVMMVLSRQSPPPAPGEPTARANYPSPAAAIPVDPQPEAPGAGDWSGHVEAPEPHDPPPAIEIHVPRRRRRRAVAPDAGRPDSVDRNFGAAVSARILRRNRGSLAACDRLAERRGERLEGARVWFVVQVDGSDRVSVTVRGDGISPALLSCYRSMSSNWRIPRVGRPFAVRFHHVHGN